jgi:ELWxxDGT repeat protein
MEQAVRHRNTHGPGAAFAILLCLTSAASVDAGLPAYQVQDSVPGPGSSFPSEMRPAAGLFSTIPTLLFTASTPAFGRELWRSDGTSLGTFMVKDILPGPEGSVPHELVHLGILNSTVLFGAGDPSRLYRSDGTLGGTALVDPLGDSSGLGNLTVVPTGFLAANVFFSAYAELWGRQVWKSDGTALGTVMVKNVYPPVYSNPLALMNVGGTLFFSAVTSAEGRELWKSDGTSAGTVLVKDIRPGSVSSIPGPFAAAGDRIYFVADDGVHGRELWTSDGTADGTVLVADLEAPGASPFGPDSITPWNGLVYFAADVPGVGRELFRTDGTAGGTVMVKDVNAGPLGSGLGDLTPSGRSLFFRAWDVVNGAELWKTDGTAEGTVLVKDVNPGSADSFPLSLVDVKGTLFFGAADGASGRELWRSDGREGGTFRVQDIAPGAPGALDADPTSPTLVNGLLYFSADDGATGQELWATDFIFGHGFEP